MGYKMRTKPASMRVVKAKPEKTEGHTCGECAKGCWNEQNLNYKGNYFYGYCEYSCWAKTKDGRCVFLDNTPACEAFEAGEKQKGAAK
ncbi:MAG: hypothetical protein J6U89_06170 [Bacteroidaceae bacterium]|nr:hypothetical protein [Bacteroidaceae bacterium]